MAEPGPDRLRDALQDLEGDALADELGEAAAGGCFPLPGLKLRGGRASDSRGAESHQLREAKFPEAASQERSTRSVGGRVRVAGEEGPIWWPKDSVTKRKPGTRTYEFWETSSSKDFSSDEESPSSTEFRSLLELPVDQKSKTTPITYQSASAKEGIRTASIMDSSVGCLKCGLNYSMSHLKKIRPEIVQDPGRSCETYRLDINAASSVSCGITDFIFDLKTAVTITYHFDSWSKHMNDGKMSNLTVAGPLLNIEANPVEGVAAVHFPHVLCLADTKRSRVYIAHFTEEGMILEKPNGLNTSHAVLNNPRFSPCGVVVKKTWFKQNTKVHAVVLLYQKQKVSHPTFHLYLLPNDSSLKKAVHDCENVCPSMRLTKPSGTRYPLKLGSCFFVRTAHHVQICPEELVLNYLRADMEQQYVELYTEHMENKLELSVMEREKDQLVWKTCVRKGELMLDSVESHQESMKSSPITKSSLAVRNILEPHFIDKHREELIQRTTEVDGILDRLYGHILIEEQYQKISSKNTNPEKMRELYKLMKGWDNSCKEQLYQALKTKQPYLINDLNRRPNLNEEAP